LQNSRRILKYVLQYKGLIILPFLMIGISIGLDMFNPYLGRVIIDRVIIGQDFSVMGIALTSLLVIGLLRGGMAYARSYLFDLLAENSMLNLRKDLFSHIQSMPFSFFDKMNTGELMSRMTGDIDSIRAVISYGISLFLENVLYFVIASVILFTINWKLALISLAAMPFIAYLAIRLGKEEGEAYEKISDQAAVLNTTAEENIAGVRVVKAFAREPYEIKKFWKENHKNYSLGLDEVKIWSKYFPLIEALGNIGVVAILTFGGSMVIGEEMTIGTLVSFNGYLWMLIWPMRMLGWLGNMLAQCEASAGKIFRIMDTGSEIKDDPHAVELKSCKGHVRFEGVYFRYRGKDVLKDINIDAPPGSAIAIMGATGAGKSSVINLIGRYYDVYRGRVLVDGIDVKKIRMEDLRNSMAVVMQDVFLFSDTIASNIAFGVENASQEEIEEAAKAARS
jgi:ATP-binding cassette subfamily B multidrug efflux pump